MEARLFLDPSMLRTGAPPQTVFLQTITQKGNSLDLGFIPKGEPTHHLHKLTSALMNSLRTTSRSQSTGRVSHFRNLVQLARGNVLVTNKLGDDERTPRKVEDVELVGISAHWFHQQSFSIPSVASNKFWKSAWNTISQVSTSEAELPSSQGMF